MKIHFRVYKYEETLEREFSGPEEAQKTLDMMNREHSDLFFEPYVELGDGCEIHIGYPDYEELQDPFFDDADGIMVDIAELQKEYMADLILKN